MSADTSHWRTSRSTVWCRWRSCLRWKKQVETILLMWKRMLSLLSKCTPRSRTQSTDLISTPSMLMPTAVICSHCSWTADQNQMNSILSGSAEDAVLHTIVEQTICLPQVHDSDWKVALPSICVSSAYKWWDIGIMSLMFSVYAL